MENARQLVTEAEFLALPETTDKVELLEGEVIVSPSPTVRHQLLVQRLLVALSSWAARRTPRPLVGQAPLDVHFGPGRILQPDLFVVLAGVDETHEGPIEAIPELCVEVLSRDRVYDRITKRMIYAQAGVEEYWTVEQTGLVEVWTGAGLATSREVQDRLSSPLLPGFELPIAELGAR